MELAGLVLVGCGRGLGSGKGVLGLRDSSDCIAFSWSAKPGFLSRATGTLSPPFPSRAGPGGASPLCLHGLACRVG